MTRFNLDEYVTVNERLKAFWAKYPEGRVHTHLTHIDGPESPAGRMAIIEAAIFADRTAGSVPIATGIAKEREGGPLVNKTSFIENCETSAIGRALANAGFLTDKRPSREEMEAVHRAEQEHERNLQLIKDIAKEGSKGLKDKVKGVWLNLKEDPIMAANFLEEIQRETIVEE